MKQMIYRAFIATLLLALLTGIAYPFAVTGLAQLFFKDKADGSMITQNGSIIGSELIGQNFAKPEYFHPRPSAAGEKGYDASASSGSNLGPTNAKLQEKVKAEIDKVMKENPGITVEQIPIDMVTASASGLDPHISPAAASLQVARVAEARGVKKERVKELVQRYTEGRQFGIFGEPRVNVLLLNLALDRLNK